MRLHQRALLQGCAGREKVAVEGNHFSKKRMSDSGKKEVVGQPKTEEHEQTRVR